MSKKKGLRQDGEAVAKERMSACFNEQVQILDDLQYWNNTGISKNEFFDNYIQPLKSVAESKAGNVHPDNIPCIIIDGGLLSLYSQMNLIELDGIRGKNFLNSRQATLAEGMTLPNSLFFLAIDVETGERRKGISPNDNDEAFAKENRQRMIVEGGIAIVRRDPAVLKRVYIDCTGNHFDASYVPFLCLDNSQPELDYDSFPVLALSYWGAASCGEYVGV